MEKTGFDPIPLAVLLHQTVQGLGIDVPRLSLRAGAKVFEQGVAQRKLFCIESGLTAARYGSPKGQDCLIALNGPGETLGDLEYFQGGSPAVCTVQVVRDSVLAGYSYTDLDRMAVANPGLLYALGSVMAGRLSTATQRVSASIVYPLEYNMLKVLLSGGLHPSGVPRSELAAWLGHTERHVNRLLRKLEAEGLLVIQGKAVRISDRDRAVRRMRQLEG